MKPSDYLFLGLTLYFVVNMAYRVFRHSNNKKIIETLNKELVEFEENIKKFTECKNLFYEKMNNISDNLKSNVNIPKYFSLIKENNRLKTKKSNIQHYVSDIEKLNKEVY